MKVSRRYFDFHPAPRADGVSPETHGLIPVWGFGTVVDSTHARIHIGERVYGYFAPTRYLLVPVSPSDVNKHAFYVPRPHLPAGKSFLQTRCVKRAKFIPVACQIVVRIIKFCAARTIRSMTLRQRWKI